MGQPAPPQYPGGMYYPRSMEGMFTKRNVVSANGFGLLALYIGALFALASGDAIARGFAHFLVLSGGLLATFMSLGAAVYGTKGTDQQNLGLFVWAGLFLLGTLTLFAWIG